MSARRPADNHHPDSAGGVQRRRRGAARLSCAECRRLKLRCDRKVPCESCIKRGCSAICPDGSLTTGKGNRFVLASTQELHEKISELCNRIRELEDALRESHSHMSNQSHPLLSEELLRLKAPLQRETNEPTSNGVKEELSADVVDSFGSLSITHSGKTKFYGHTANSWNEDPEEESEDRTFDLEQVLPQDILALGSAFPTSPTNSPITNTNDRFNNLVGYLPDVSKATELRDIYYQRAAWMYNPISRQQFEEEVFPHFFNNDFAPPSPPSDSASSHRLALMFIVLAIGTLMDPNQAPYNLEAEKYHQLARAALFKSSIFDDPTLHAVQALFLMSYYLFLADRHGTGSGSRWIIMGFAVKLAQSIGLHRDSTRWKMEAPETQSRRETFWELYTYDSWQCLTFGRPPSFSLPHVDCKFPHPSEDPTGERSFDTWKHRFSAECMSIVHDQAFGAKTPSYQTILQLDRKLRAFPVPSVLQVAGFGSTDPGYNSGYPDTLGLIMQRHIVLAIREMNLLYMHRGFFARAIGDSPKDPLGSPYGTSVIAAYRSAGSLVALVRDLDSQLPEPTERLWFLWTHLFSCSVVLGSIVTRCPSMSLAPSALVQLDSACELFGKVADKFRARKVFNIMQNLHQKAHISLQEFREGKQSPVSSNMSFRPFLEGSPEVEEDDELSKLGGKTRLISQKDPTKSPSPSLVTRSPNTQNPIVPLPLPNASDGVHPSVVEYLSSFNFPTSASRMQPSAPTQPPPPPPSMYPVQSPSVFTAGRNAGTYEGVDGAGAMHFHPNSELHAREAIQSPTSASSTSGGAHTLVLPSQHHASPVLAHGHGGAATGSHQQYFPQYFPVFDYGTAGSEAYSPMQLAGPSAGYEQDHAMGYDGVVTPNGVNSGINGINGRAYAGANGHQGRRDITPEASMHTAWMDFVTQMSMNG
ncbi:fungal-specific transcription factor domain-containing protein [Phellopilus nigrolimitatus]|nr:fungal-specific transcription factor domain-containing protein [Phellopilus nigrolimitatus]